MFQDPVQLALKGEGIFFRPSVYFEKHRGLPGHIRRLNNISGCVSVRGMRQDHLCGKPHK